MRIAIIDCGTNTFHLLIVETAEKGIYKKLFKTKTVVKLGEAGITKHFIADAPFKRGINALKRFANKIAVYEVEKVYAFATAAVRKAKNGKEFIAVAEKQTGIKIELITGAREAELIYYGVREAIHLGNQTSLVMDIGGGSVEFIICNQTKLFWKHSYEIGAALLLEKFEPSDPITLNEIELLTNHLQKTLSSLFAACKKHKPVQLIGSSGSFDTFAELILQQKPKAQTLGKRIAYNFMMDDYLIVHQQLKFSTTKQRMQMNGLIKMRVDMIVLASLLLTFVLDKTKIKQMQLSAFALKEGILAEIINNEQNFITLLPRHIIN